MNESLFRVTAIVSCLNVCLRVEVQNFGPYRSVSKCIVEESLNVVEKPCESLNEFR
jgi:hypothetical protein